ncbi:MAG: DUF6492 family protein [Bosea sp. (in: a-proteobacteria)]
MTVSNTRFAIATPSYAGDFERCRLLCDSIDRHVSGHAMHYLLIDPVDLELFRPLESSKRRIITDADLLPSWLKGWNDPFNPGRRIWSGPGALMRGVLPLRGWHVQQLRKFAVARLIPEDIILFADSDIVFLRPFSVESQMQGGKARLYRQDKAITAAMRLQTKWLASAARALGCKPPRLPADDFIGSLITWRRETALNLMAHAENVTGRHWAAAIAQRRNFSEYLIYGAFVGMSPNEAERHWIDHRSIAATTWFAHDMPEGGIEALARDMSPRQVALCVQSFIDVPVAHMRQLFERADLSA